jgi:hypothetical protein
MYLKLLSLGMLSIAFCLLVGEAEGMDNFDDQVTGLSHVFMNRCAPKAASAGC